jgi:hypothetical protein
MRLFNTGHRPFDLLRHLPLVALAVIALTVIPGSRGLASVLPTGIPAVSHASESTGGQSPVEVTRDGGGVPMFDMPAMAPGRTVDNCIVVAYEGTMLSTEVSLFGSVSGNGLADYLDLVIEVGTGGTFGDCGGFSASDTVFMGTLSDFGRNHASFADGLRWSPTEAGAALTYRFAATLHNDNGAQGKHASASVVWETRSG